MTLNLSLINLKDYSNKKAILLLFLFSTILSCSTTQQQKLPIIESEDSKKQDQIEAPAIIPPWELWDAQFIEDEELKKAIDLELRGNWKQSQELYKKIINRAKGQILSEDAFVRSIGIDLKQGQSRQALEEINQHLKDSGRKLDEVSPVLALLAAYSYLHLGNDSQFFAWCKVVLEKTKGQGIVARQARMEATKYLSTIRKDKFNDLFYQWSIDSQLDEIFIQEKDRRKNGGEVVELDYKKWFRPDTYQRTLVENDLRESDLGNNEQSLLTTDSKYLISVLLPESGKFARPGQFVRQGIELAVQKSSLADKISLNFLDTKGEQDLAVELYSQEADLNNSQFVLGPLLSKEAEAIALKSKEKELPFITFTKKENISALSPLCFQLGFTVKDQAEEIVSYLSSQLKAKTILILTSTNSDNQDFVASIKAFALKNSINIQEKEISEKNFNAEAFIADLENLKALSAIVFADSIEKSIFAVSAIKNSSLQNIKLIGTTLWNDAAAIRAYSAPLEEAIIIAPFVLNSSRTEVVNFVSSYNEVYHTAPDILAAQSYDAMQVVLAGLEKSQAPELSEVRKNLLKYLYSINSLNAVTGVLTVDTKREFDRRMSVLQVYKGGLIELMLGDRIVGFLPNDRL